MKNKMSDKYYKRRISDRKLRTKILLVCEGGKTEPKYFRKFPVDKEVLEVTISGEGKNTDSLVESAIEKKKKAEYDGEPYNQVWCIFDKDSFSHDKFNRAIILAENNKIKVAYSNEAFELWYLLHFHYFDTGINRAEYYVKLNALLEKTYEKSADDIYGVLRGKQKYAIRHATKLFSSYPSCNPYKNNPSTTVFRLVQELNKFIS
ncbi:MAG: RloB family protein [Candidatus Omnitrophota bacterium]